MRTTTDLPADTYQQVKKLAAEQQRSLSAMVAYLTGIGLARFTSQDASDEFGLPVLRAGRTITADEVAEFLAED